MFLVALLILLPFSTSFASLNWNPDDGFPPLEEVGQGGTEPPDSELVILEGTIVVNPKGGDPNGPPKVPVSGGKDLQTGSGASAPGSNNGNAASDASVDEASQFPSGDFSASGDLVADDGVTYFARTGDGRRVLPGRRLSYDPETIQLFRSILKAIDDYQSTNPSDDAVLNWSGGSEESANALTPQHITLLAAAWLSSASYRPAPNPAGPNLANPVASSYAMTNFVQTLPSGDGTPVVGSSELPQYQLGGDDPSAGLRREIKLINANGDAANAGRFAALLDSMVGGTMLDNLAKLGFSTPSGKLGDTLKLLYDVFHDLLHAANTYPGLSGSATQTGGDSFFALLDTARSAQGVHESLAVSLYSDTTSVDDNAQNPEPPAIQTKPPIIFGGGNTSVPHKITFYEDKTLAKVIGTFSYTDVAKISTTDQLVTSSGEEIPIPSALTREGFTFAGWGVNTSIDGVETVTPFDWDKTWFTDVAVFGRWTRNNYTITFKDGDETLATVNGWYDYETSLPDDPTKNGYTFTGWRPAVPAKIPAENLTVQATWTVNGYTVTYKVDGETYATQVYDGGGTVTPPDNPTKTGHSFAGWNPALPEKMPAKNLTVQASWTVNNYNLSFKIDDELYGNSVLTAYGAAIIPPTLTLPEGTSVVWDDYPAVMPAQDLTVTGRFTYTVYYRYIDAIYDTQTYVAGAPITPPDGPGAEGHSFSHWEGLPDDMPGKSIHVDAAFTVNSYTVIYMVDGERYDEKTYEYGAEVTPPTAPKKEGYAFAGWDATLPETMPAENLTVNATWARLYNLTFVVVDVLEKTEQVACGAPIVPPVCDQSKYPGCHFVWETYPAAMPEGDLTVSGTIGEGPIAPSALPNN